MLCYMRARVLLVSAENSSCLFHSHTMPTASSSSSSSDVSDSELFAELEAELDDGPQQSGFDMGEYREKRIAQLQEELRSRPAPSSKDPQPFDLGIDASQMGRYIKLDTEKEAIALLEKSGRKVVLHFSHAEFNRCKLMDQHLEVRGDGRREKDAEMILMLLCFGHSTWHPCILAHSF